MSEENFVPHRLPASMGSLASVVPPAPPGTIFVLAQHGGYAVPPREYTLLFGREQDDVHVAIGVGDPYVSRFHGRLTCDGREWWLRNTGRLPIRLPREALLLADQEMPLRDGYLPLFIGRPPRREHLLEIRVVGWPTPHTVGGPGLATKPSTGYDLSPVEHLVLIALAQRYLRGEPNPQPVAWNQVAADLNRVSSDREWNPHAVANVVGGVRKRLSTGSQPIPGITRTEDMAEPLGNALNHALIRALLESTTLVPSHLGLLDAE